MSESAVPASIGFELVTRMAAAISDAAPWLSELDGETGDGDHGVNMRAGFDEAARRVRPGASLPDALETLSQTLLDIGGAMGPLYGVFFEAMARASAGRASIDAAALGAMLTAGTQAVMDIGGAHVGDKTLVDVLVPTSSTFSAAANDGCQFAAALSMARGTAARSRDATAGLVARVGRSARAGERSHGQIDAGAASAALIVATICDVFAAALTNPVPAG